MLDVMQTNLIFFKWGGHETLLRPPHAMTAAKLVSLKN